MRYQVTRAYQQLDKLRGGTKNLVAGDDEDNSLPDDIPARSVVEEVEDFHLFIVASCCVIADSARSNDKKSLGIGSLGPRLCRNCGET